MPRRSALKGRPLFSTHSPKPKPKRKSILVVIAGFMYRNIKRLCMFIGLMFLLSIVGGIVLGTLLMDESSTPNMPDKMVVYLSLEGNYSDYSVSSPYSLSKKPNFRHVIDAVDHAQTDKRVKGLLVVENGGDLSLAQRQELRDALKRFRASGKPTWFYAESMDGGLGSYYIASAADEIWMQPIGTLSIPGLRAEMPYARGLLDKVGVEPEFFARKDYKDVFTSFTEKSMKENTRESVTKMLDDIAGAMIPDIAADRKMTDGQVRNIIDRGMLTDQEALAAKMVDRLDYLDVLKKEIRMKIVGTENLKAMKFIRFSYYMDDMRDDESLVMAGDKPEIALIYAVGTIISDDGSSVSASLGGGASVSARHIAWEINETIRDKNIKAIVLRVDSPGGSPTASETIRRALVHAQENGKKVVVSMGGTAASGGYWISASADRIFAMPTTITGSIGVAGGKFVFTGLWDKVGVNWDEVYIGDNSSMLSSNEKYSAAGRDRMNAMMDSIYDGFITRVAEGRRLSKERVDQIARGRVWTGASALPLGLVDEMGGLNAALDHAAILSGLKSRRDAVIVELPKEKTTFERIADLLDTQSRLGQGLSAQVAIGELLIPMLSFYGNADYMTRESIVIQ